MFHPRTSPSEPTVINPPLAAKCRSKLLRLPVPNRNSSFSPRPSKTCTVSRSLAAESLPSELKSRRPPDTSENQERSAADNSTPLAPANSAITSPCGLIRNCGLIPNCRTTTPRDCTSFVNTFFAALRSHLTTAAGWVCPDRAQYRKRLSGEKRTEYIPPLSGRDVILPSLRL